VQVNGRWYLRCDECRRETLVRPLSTPPPAAPAAAPGDEGASWRCSLPGCWNPDESPGHTHPDGFTDYYTPAAPTPTKEDDHVDS
jgi:hypothetical protein